MKVKATGRGQYKGLMRERGDVFDVDQETLDEIRNHHARSKDPHWMEEVIESAPEPAHVEAHKPAKHGGHK